MYTLRLSSRAIVVACGALVLFVAHCASGGSEPASEEAFLPNGAATPGAGGKAGGERPTGDTSTRGQAGAAGRGSTGGGGSAGMRVTYDRGGSAGMRISEEPDGGAGMGTTEPPDGSAGASVTGCTRSASCETAADIGILTGDAALDKPETNRLLVEGSTSQWLVLVVAEDFSLVGGVAQKLTAEFSSPAGADFHAYFYVDTADTAPIDSVGCDTPFAEIDGSGKTVLSWGESWVTNNTDDSRVVAVEIVASSTCSPDAVWSLTLTGGYYSERLWQVPSWCCGTPARRVRAHGEAGR
jgi:hypothetical protein